MYILTEYLPQLEAAALTLCVLGIVLWLDYLLRKEIYNRADPISFSLLLYSLVLVVTDSGVELVQLLKGNLDGRFFAITSGYIIAGIIVFFVVNRTHRAFKTKQESIVNAYLDQLSKNSASKPNVWEALKRLGKDMIEPDAFFQSNFKREKRIEFLTTVRDLTDVEIDPTEQQTQLLVTEKRVKYKARAAYLTAMLFGVIGTLVLLLLR